MTFPSSEPTALYEVATSKGVKVYVDVLFSRTKPSIVSLSDENNLSLISLRAPDWITNGIIDAALKSVGAGCLDGSNTAINVDWLRSYTVDRSPQWHRRFDKMLSYAASKGWMSAAGTAVYAYVEKW
ncbi:MAG: hypothetical protein WCE30_06475 [Mycobacterium sp.]